MTGSETCRQPLGDFSENLGTHSRWPAGQRRGRVALAGILGVFGLAAGCAPKERVARIAVAVPLTGDVGTEGQGVRRAVEMAVEEANAARRLPYRVEVVAFDDRADPKEAGNVANLISADPSIVAVVGHYNSGCCIPAAQVYNRVGLVMISPACTNPKVTRQQLEASWTGPRTVFRVVPTDDVQGSFTADFAAKKLGLKSFAVIHDKTAYGQGLAEEFRRQFEADGGKVVSFDGITIGDKDFKALLTRIKTGRPDAIYFGGLYTEAGLLLKQAKEVGFAGKFFSGDGSKTDSLFDVAGDAANGAYLTITGIPVEYLPTAKTFLENYQRRYPGVPVKPFDHFGYEAVNILLEGLARTAPDAEKLKETYKLRDRLRETIRELRYTGVLGTTSFDEKGDTLNKTITMTRADAKTRTFPPVQ